MSIIVQDPSAPTTTANSYISVADSIARAVFLGVTIPDDNAKAEAALYQGKQYVDSKCFNGVTVIDFQGTQFPRSGLMIGSATYPSDQIPQDIIDAQILAAASVGDSSLWGSGETGTNIKSEGVSSLKVEYFEGGSKSGSVTVGRADSILYKYTCNSSASTFFMVV